MYTHVHTHAHTHTHLHTHTHTHTQSLCLWKQSAEAWLGWGRLCDDLWDRSVSTGVPSAELLEYAVHSILQVRECVCFLRCV
jgi:hypothetical protein